MAHSTSWLGNLFFLVFCVSGTFASAQDYDSVMRFSIANLRSGFADMPAEEQVRRLELETLRYPERQDAYYLLAYTFSRMNAPEGGQMTKMTYPLTLKVSQLMEKVINIDSLYNGQMVVLDAYSKIHSEWSSMALSYLVKGDPDSARICFNESYRRGGINPWSLQLHRYILDALDSGAFLLSSGDHTTYYFLYLQIMENYRSDIKIADVSLLNASWYYTYLLGRGFPQFQLFDSMVFESFYTPWKDTTLEFDGITIKAKPAYADRFIGQSERIMLDLLSHYGPQKLFYLCKGSDPDQNFGMSDRGCQHYLYVRFEGENGDCSTPALDENDWKILEHLDHAQTNDRSIRSAFDMYTYWYLYYIYMRLEGHLAGAKQDYARFKQVFPQKRHPEFYQEYTHFIKYMDARN